MRLTAKHQNGFCLWPAKTTKHSVESSRSKAGKGDVVKEVTEVRKKFVWNSLLFTTQDMNASVHGTDACNDFFIKQKTSIGNR
jgi:alpha-L-fucosidase